MRNHLPAAVALALLCALPARSEEVEAGPWYVNGSLAALSHADGTDNYGVTGRVGGGYRINRYLSAEVDYARVLDTTGDDSRTAALSDAKIDGFEVAARGEVPITGALSAYGRVGVLDWHRKFGRFDAGSGQDLTTGIGLRYAMSEALSLTGSFDYYNDVGIGSGDGTRQVNLGAQFSF